MSELSGGPVMGILDVLANISKYIPTVKRPERKPTLYERFMWTGIVLVIYLIMANIPLWGIGRIGGQDPLLLWRTIFASRRGTLMELGISPIVTAGLIMQVLVGSKLIQLDLTDPKEREKFTAAQKTLILFFAIFEATAYTFSGIYGHLTTTATIAIILQLVTASILVMLFDEMIQKGWGIGSGVSLFILAGVAEHFIWGMFSPAPTLNPSVDGIYYGVLVELVRGVLSGKVAHVIIRTRSPDLIGLLVALSLIFILIYLEGMKIEIPVTHQRTRSIRSRVPLKFLYVSNIPVLLAGILIGDLQFMSQLLWYRFGDNPWITWLADFRREGENIIIEGGLVYYLMSPRGFLDVMANPIRVLIYAGLFAIIAIVFGFMWVEIAGMNPRDQAEQMIKAGLDIPGIRRSPKLLERILARYIYPLTLLSSLIVVGVAITADIFGVMLYGGGIGILLSVGIIYQYYSLIAYERALEAYPLLRRLVGE